MAAELEECTFDCSGNAQRCMYHFIRSIKKFAEYAGRTYEYGGDVRWTIENLEVYNIPKPSYPDEAERDSRQSLIYYEVEFEEYSRRKSCLEENLVKVYCKIWRQCSYIMQMNLKEEDNYSTYNRKCDVIWLIKAIKQAVFYSKYRYYPVDLCDAMGNLYRFKQGRKMSNRAFKEKFIILVAVVDELGGDLVHPGLIDEELKLMDSNLSLESASAEQLEKAKEVAKEKFLACMLLRQADQNRHEKLLRDLHNGYLLRKVLYPKTIAKAFELLVNYK